MTIDIGKITVEISQEADNEVGSEHAEIILQPVLINLFREGKVDYYFTIKSEHGFSFNDKEEVVELLDKMNKMAETWK